MELTKIVSDTRENRFFLSEIDRGARCLGLFRAIGSANVISSRDRPFRFFKNRQNDNPKSIFLFFRYKYSFKRFQIIENLFFKYFVPEIGLSYGKCEKDRNGATPSSIGPIVFEIHIHKKRFLIQWAKRWWIGCISDRFELGSIGSANMTILPHSWWLVQYLLKFNQT